MVTEIIGAFPCDLDWPERLLRLEREILILIHQYINNGYHIVLDVNSGSVHVVDPVVYDAIAAVSEQVPEMDKPEKLSEEVTANVHKKLERDLWK